MVKIERKKRMECPICIEPFNYKKKAVQCLHCEYTACQECLKKYLLEMATEAKCMNCQKGWDKIFLSRCFTKQFLTKEYKKRRGELLYTRERCLFPTTMEEIQRREKIEQIQTRLASLHAKKQEIQMKIRQTQEQLYVVSNRRHVKTENTIHYIRPCVKDGCNGYIDESKSECALCHAHICLECNIICEKEAHECKEEDVETWKCLMRTTKCCPSCHTRIFKISGCDQMWCTQCHQAFSWRTGEIVKGMIHNPHYYEFMANRPHENREVNDTCGELPTIYEIRNKIDRLERAKLVSREDGKWILNFHRLIVHIRAVELPRLPVRFHPNENIELRIRFLRKDLSETDFKKRIQEREKRYEKLYECRKLFEMVIAVSTDLLTEFLGVKYDLEQIENIHHQMIALISYTNQNIGNLNKIFQSQMRLIGPQLEFVSPHNIS